MHNSFEVERRISKNFVNAIPTESGSTIDGGSTANRSTAVPPVIGGYTA